MRIVLALLVGLAPAAADLRTLAALADLSSTAVISSGYLDKVIAHAGPDLAKVVTILKEKLPVTREALARFPQTLQKHTGRKLQFEEGWTFASVLADLRSNICGQKQELKDSVRELLEGISSEVELPSLDGPIDAIWPCLCESLNFSDESFNTVAAEVQKDSSILSTTTLLRGVRVMLPKLMDSTGGVCHADCRAGVVAVLDWGLEAGQKLLSLRDVQETVPWLPNVQQALSGWPAKEILCTCDGVSWSGLAALIDEHLENIATVIFDLGIREDTDSGTALAVLKSEPYRVHIATLARFPDFWLSAQGQCSTTGCQPANSQMLNFLLDVGNRALTYYSADVPALIATAIRRLSADSILQCGCGGTLEFTPLFNGLADAVFNEIGVFFNPPPPPPPAGGRRLQEPTPATTTDVESGANSGIYLVIHSFNDDSCAQAPNNADSSERYINYPTTPTYGTTYPECITTGPTLSDSITEFHCDTSSAPMRFKAKFYEGSTSCTGKPVEINQVADGRCEYYTKYWCGEMSEAPPSSASPPPASCRSDICGDYGNDCCAGPGEPRSCREGGYHVVPGGTSYYAECPAEYVYQCCPDREITPAQVRSLQGQVLTSIFSTTFLCSSTACQEVTSQVMGIVDAVAQSYTEVTEWLSFASLEWCPASADGGSAGTEIKQTFTIAGNVNDFDSTKQAAFKKALVDEINTKVSSDFLKITPSNVALKITSASVAVEATIQAATPTLVTDVSSALTALASEPTSSLTSKLGVTVEAVAPPQTSTVAVQAGNAVDVSGGSTGGSDDDPPIGLIAGAGGGAVIVLILVILIYCKFCKSKSKPVKKTSPAARPPPATKTEELMMGQPVAVAQQVQPAVVATTTASAQLPKFCTNCGTAVKGPFCTNCGQKQAAYVSEC